MKRKKIIYISLFFLSLGIIVLAFSLDLASPTSIWGFISVILGTAGSIISIFIPTNIIYEFTENDNWIEFEDYYKLIIPSSKHGFGKNPNIKIEKKLENGNYTEVHQRVEISPKGDIHIISPKITGRAKII